MQPLSLKMETVLCEQRNQNKFKKVICSKQGYGAERLNLFLAHSLVFIF